MKTFSAREGDIQRRWLLVETLSDHCLDPRQQIVFQPRQNHLSLPFTHSAAQPGQAVRRR